MACRRAAVNHARTPVCYHYPMARPRKESVSVSLTIRMTPEDRELLDQLVAKRALELSDEGLGVTATSVIRGLIRREARSQGLLPQLDSPAELGTPPPMRAVPRKSTQLAIPLADVESDERIAELPAQLHAVMGLPTPMVPTGMEPIETPPLVIHSSPTPCPIAVRPERAPVDPEKVRTRAVRAIRARKLSQRDLVDRAGVPTQVVSRFLLGDKTSDSRLIAIARALDALDP